MPILYLCFFNSSKPFSEDRNRAEVEVFHWTTWDCSPVCAAARPHCQQMRLRFLFNLLCLKGTWEQSSSNMAAWPGHSIYSQMEVSITHSICYQRPTMLQGLQKCSPVGAWDKHQGTTRENTIFVFKRWFDIMTFWMQVLIWIAIRHYTSRGQDSM